MSTPPVGPLSPSRLPVAVWRSTFASLQVRSFRLFLVGQVISNTGIWMQRIVQDWLVLTLTGSVAAVGVATALQLMPTLFLGLAGGALADRYPRRRILQATQTAMAASAATLALLTLSNSVRVWHVYLVALALGVVAALDKPTRQPFVTDMVAPERLGNAVSLHASTFQIAGMVGAAASGLLIHPLGEGPLFAVSAVLLLVPVLSLTVTQPGHRERPRESGGSDRGLIMEAVRYVITRQGALWPIVLVGAFGMFTTHLPVTLAAYAHTSFDSGASGYAKLTTFLAVGSLAGALVSASRPAVRLRSIVVIASLLAAAMMTASLSPTDEVLGVFLVVIGAGTLMLFASTNSAVQLAADADIRGRVCGIYFFVFVGSGAMGGPLLGAVSQAFGPQAGMLTAGLVPGIATVLVANRLARTNHLRVRLRTDVGMWRAVAIVPR